ncbi:DUF4232 domain-containing protein [Streptomyces sp. NPDC085929]|uniref:DUF4232 domain-containing protein n=1 Tax=Streptomyces sp. NPDC085929 TaxID=3365739 RepID=UPI0037D73052
MSNVLPRAAALAAAALLATTGASLGATQASALPTATPTCTVADLDLAIGARERAGGSVNYPILFTNTTGHTCALRGYPGVSVTDARHHQIGTSAIRTGEPISTVFLGPDDTVTAIMRTNSRSVAPNCRQTSSYVKVYPPNSGVAVEIPYNLRVCGMFEISPVEASD